LPDPVPSKNRGPYGFLAHARSQVETLQLASATASNVRNLGYVIAAFPPGLLPSSDTEKNQAWEKVFF
jgi:hypothetical protein